MSNFDPTEQKISEPGDTITVRDSIRINLFPTLQHIQEEKGYISDENMQHVANKFGIHPVEVYSVVTFYSFLTVKPQGENIIHVCRCATYKNASNNDVIGALEKRLDVKMGETSDDKKYTLKSTNCIGMCDHAPAILINGHLVGNVTEESANTIIDECESSSTNFPGVYVKHDIKRTGPIVFSDIEPYVGIKKALEIGKEAVLEQVKESNIRGRGGAGFPTGLKWRLAADAPGLQKFVVCNADEGEPGTFKDRVLITEYAELMFEGMIIAGYAIGGDKGILYLRGEYSSFVPELKKVLEKMRKDNALGNNIFGNENFNFNIRIKLGSGAYVCGEETALIESLEGNRGEPRNRPPFPVNTGYFGCPTVVNNVETDCSVVHIIAKGADWFKKTGTPTSTGSKLISVSGDCAQPGVYEVPFGTSVKEILEIVKAENTKAVQIGGASGTCLSEKNFERKLGYEDLSTGGAVMIFNKSRNMLKSARNFLEFFKEESCGQCTPCREGIPVLIEYLDKVQYGDFTGKDYDDLKSLATTMKLAAKCGLGQSSPKAFLDILKNWY